MMQKNQHDQRQVHVSTWLLVLLVAVVVIGTAFFFLSDGSAPLNNTNGTSTTTAWLATSSDIYGFTMEYPEDWEFASSTAGGITPLFNVFQSPSGAPVSSTIVHHSNITNVSIFPEGIPTEGLFGETEDVDFNPGFDITDDSRMYVTEDGVPFAAFLKPESAPSRWSDAGFVWMRVHMSDARARCFDVEKNEISAEQCDPLTEDHTVRWSGTVDDAVWETELEMVRNIQLGQ